MARICVCDDYFELSDDGVLCLKPGTSGLRQILRFPSPGTFQFHKDDYPWLARVRVKVQGAGGGSAGASSASGQMMVRPGGGGGAYAESLLDVSTLGAVENIVVGAGGQAGLSNTAGQPGGPSSFGGLVTAPGGPGGPASGASGTSAATLPGVPGATIGLGQIVIGGGASGGSIRLSAANGMSGAGGDSVMGKGGMARVTDGPGTSPTGYGAGAGGALSYDGTNYPGEYGGHGLVLVELYA